MTDAQARTAVLYNRRMSSATRVEVLPFILTAAGIDAEKYIDHQRNFYDYVIDELRKHAKQARRAHNTTDVNYFMNAIEIIKIMEEKDKTFSNTVYSTFRTDLNHRPGMRTPRYSGSPAGLVTPHAGMSASIVASQEDAIVHTLNKMVAGTRYKAKDGRKYTLQNIKVYPKFRDCVQTHNFGGYAKASGYELLGFIRVFQKLWGHINFPKAAHRITRRSGEAKTALDALDENQMLQIYYYYNDNLLPREYSIVNAVIHEKIESFLKDYVQKEKDKIDEAYRSVYKAYLEVSNLSNSPDPSIRQRANEDYNRIVKGQASNIRIIMHSRKIIRDLLDNGAPTFAPQTANVRKSLSPICIGHDESMTRQHYERIEDSINLAVSKANDALSFEAFVLAEQAYNEKLAVSKEERRRRRSYDAQTNREHISANVRDFADAHTRGSSRISRTAHKVVKRYPSFRKKASYEIFTSQFQNTDTTFVVDLSNIIYDPAVTTNINNYLRDEFSLLALAGVTRLGLTGIPPIASLSADQQRHYREGINRINTNTSTVRKSNMKNYMDFIAGVAGEYSSNVVDEEEALTKMRDYMVNSTIQDILDYLNTAKSMMTPGTEFVRLEPWVDFIRTGALNSANLKSGIKQLIQIYSRFTDPDSKDNAEALISNLIVATTNLELQEHVLQQVNNNILSNRYNDGVVDTFSR